MSVVVKICGVRSIADARAAVDAGADLLGLNFVPSSPRHVDPDTARALAHEVRGAPLVGVFADAERALVEDVARHVGLAMVQLHGAESPEFCRGLGLDAIKALRARPGDDLAARAAAYDTRFVLVDAYAPGALGGTGVPLDPEAVHGIPPERLFVAGGLRPDTVADVVRRMRPHGVDVASGVERSPGVKDHDQIREFIRRAKSA